MEPVTITLPEMTTLKDAATRLGVSVGTVRAWIDQGKLAAVRTPAGTRRPLAADVDQLVEEMYGTPVLRFDQPEDRVPPQQA